MNVTKLLRIAMGLTQFDLSLVTGIPNYRISGIETRRLLPSDHELERLASALGAKKADLLKEITKEDLFPESDCARSLRHSGLRQFDMEKPDHTEGSTS